MQLLGWKFFFIICLLVFGVVFFVFFVLWERMFVFVEFILFILLVDCNVVGLFVFGVVLFISYYSWFSFFILFLQVVYDLSISEVGYVLQIYGVGGCVVGVVVGFMIY